MNSIKFISKPFIKMNNSMRTGDPWVLNPKVWRTCGEHHPYDVKYKPGVVPVENILPVMDYKPGSCGNKGVALARKGGKRRVSKRRSASKKVGGKRRVSKRGSRGGSSCGKTHKSKKGSKKRRSSKGKKKYNKVGKRRTSGGKRRVSKKGGKRRTSRK